MSDLPTDLREDPYPLEAHLGYSLTVWEKDHAVVELPLAPHLANRQGLPHGGIHATLMDTAMGYAGCFTGDARTPQMALTLSLTVNYLSRPKGSRLIADAHRTGGGKSTFFAASEVRDDLGEVIATATGVFRYRKG